MFELASHFRRPQGARGFGFFLAGLLFMLLMGPGLVGCAAFAGGVDRAATLAGERVADYCENVPADGRAFGRRLVNEKAAPHRVCVECDGDAEGASGCIITEVSELDE